MGAKIIVFPQRHRHARASQRSRKSSRRTSPPVAALSRWASLSDTPRSPLSTSDRCDSEHSQSAANFAWVVSLWLSIQTAKGCFVLIPQTLLLAKSICQALLCWQEMDIHGSSLDPLLMAKRVTKPVEIQVEGAPLYVGAWIRARNFKPAEVAKNAPINEGYLSEIISGKKKNPSRQMLARIASYIGVKVSDFDRPPPSAKLLDQLSDFDPETIADLIRDRGKAS